jgi:hypothetical protein
MRKQTIGMLEVGLILGGLGIIYWFSKQHAEGGRDLWSALGFPYGAIGNIPGLGGAFFAGNVTGALTTGAAVPVILTPATILPTALTDTTGTALTDGGGTVLTDVTGHYGPPGLVPSYNNSRL